MCIQRVINFEIIYLLNNSTTQAILIQESNFAPAIFLLNSEAVSLFIQA